MYHLVDNFQDKAGNALVGYYVKLKVPGGAYATLYADENLTPIVSVSGVADTAVTDANGRFDIFVTDGVYDIEFFDKNDINQRIDTVPSVPMYGETLSATASLEARDTAVASAAAAATSETNAATSASAAASSQVSAASSAASAATSEANAATSSSAALTAGKIYATTAAGVAANPTTGDGWWLQNGDYLDYYTTQSSAAQDEGFSLAAASLVDAVITTFDVASATTDVLHEWEDDTGKVVARLDSDGTYAATAVEAETINGVPVGSYSQVFGGPLTIDDTTREIIASYGQSLSNGVNGNNPAALTADQPYGNLMLSGGVRFWQGAAVSSQTLVPHIEASGGGYTETILGSMQAMIFQLFNRIGVEPQRAPFNTVAIAPGQDATALAGLISGTTPFTRYQQAVERIVALSTGETVKARTMVWLQGESDTSSDTTYPTRLVALAESIDSMVRTATGQTEPCRMLTYQLSRQQSAYWYSEAAASSPLIQVALPSYAYEFAGTVGVQFDAVHKSAFGYAMMGATLGVAWFCENILKRPWRPLQLAKDARGNLRYRTDGTDLIVRYDVPHGGMLAFDTNVNGATYSYLGDVQNKGFNVYTSGGARKAVTDVVIEGRNEVRIVGANIAAGDVLRVGITDPTSTNPGLTNLRDRQGDWLTFDDLNDEPVHNWALLESYTF